jgi:hypothetical protein
MSKAQQEKGISESKEDKELWGKMMMKNKEFEILAQLREEVKQTTSKQINPWDYI